MHAKSSFAFFLYIVGAIIGLVLISIAAWGDYEAASYGFARRANESLRGLSCPILLAIDETGTISLNISNPTDKPMHPSVRTELSTRYDPQVYIESTALAPGETKRLKWSVGPENIALRSFIFASVQVYATYPIPSQTATCGILIVDMPWHGMSTLIVFGMFGVIAMGCGLYWINKDGFYKSRAVNVWYAIQFLAVFIIIGYVSSFTGAWLLSIVFLVVALLTIILIIAPVLAGNT